MGDLSRYRAALGAAQPEESHAALVRVLAESGESFASFVVDHGLGPLWHERTKSELFHTSRLAAEALFLAQNSVLREIDSTFCAGAIDYAVIKGAASRVLLYENPALRACLDLDLLVRPCDRVRAVEALVNVGFTALPAAKDISREIVLSRGPVDVDLHWGLLREGRLREEPTNDMLNRRTRSHGMWMLAAEDALVVLLVHPAFAKHLAGWNMGLHRVVDINRWIQEQRYVWRVVRERLEAYGVMTAAWATLRWVDMLTRSGSNSPLDVMLADLRPGALRATWLNYWLGANLSERTSSVRWVRLLGFSVLLHDKPHDSMRALLGRHRAHRRRTADLAVFGKFI